MESASVRQAVPTPDADDDALARRAQRGEEAAFSELVTLHMRRAFAVAYRLLGNQQDAEDLVQDAFVAAYQKLHTWDASRAFAPWFYRILTNRGLNLIESNRIRAAEELPGTVPAQDVLPDRMAGQAELREDVRAALAGLPPRQRMVIELVELEGFSAAEVADILGITPATARWHLHTARGALRTVLSRHAA